MQTIFTRHLKTCARLVLCAYVMLLGVEILHHDDAIIPQSASVNNGASHLAHRIITERVECQFCQGAFSQIHTGEFRLTVFNVVDAVEQTPPILHPQLPVIDRDRLRGPPRSA